MTMSPLKIDFVVEGGGFLNNDDDEKKMSISLDNTRYKRMAIVCLYRKFF